MNNYDIFKLNIVESSSYSQINSLSIFFPNSGEKKWSSMSVKRWKHLVTTYCMPLLDILPTVGGNPHIKDSGESSDNIGEQQHPTWTFVWITQAVYKSASVGTHGFVIFFGISDLNHKSSKHFYSTSSVSAACPVALSTVFEAFFFFFFCAFRLAELCSKAISSGSSTSNSDL